MAFKSKSPKKTPKKECELLIWGVPRKLRDRFKAKCVRKGVTMKETVVDLLRNFVSNA